MGLLSAFKSFIQKENLFQPKDKLLLAVSGGVDSIVLCELCKQAGYDFVIAHSNFQLRGEESERDEQFVRSLGEKYNAPVLVERFETEVYAHQHKCSIQVAARELRYTWFKEIINSDFWSKPNIVNKSFGAGDADHFGEPWQNHMHRKWIVTAHHSDDNVETVLMNFFKGTGIAGLRGILPRQGNIVRPLLFASKEQLKNFAEENKLNWVEDSSNAQEKYTRNFIRNKLLPLINEVYPQAASNIANSVQRFREIEFLYRQSIEQILKKLVEQKGEELHIPILKLKKANVAGTILYELIHPFGFTPKQVEEVLDLMESESGKYIASSTHRILKNRSWLIIAPVEATKTQHVLIEAGHDSVSFEMGTLQLTEINDGEWLVELGEPHIGGADKANKLPVFSSHDALRTSAERFGEVGPKSMRLSKESSRIAFLDAADIRFPLLLRKWKQGDYFYPLGMRKKKKLARFFIDQKLSATDKEKVWVLEMDKKILWVVGHRVDDRFKITERTRKVLQIEWLMS